MAARNLSPQFSRREALGLGAVTAAGVAVALTGCSATPSANGAALQAGLELGPLADVPVGAGRNFEVNGTKLVVTQPTAGELYAFSAICTHEGCVVGCRDTEIKCDCHSAIFDPTTGEALAGPADAPLQSFPITVTDGVIFTA